MNVQVFVHFVNKIVIREMLTLLTTYRTNKVVDGLNLGSEVKMIGNDPG